MTLFFWSICFDWAPEEPEITALSTGMLDDLIRPWTGDALGIVEVDKAGIIGACGGARTADTPQSELQESTCIILNLKQYLIL